MQSIRVPSDRKKILELRLIAELRELEENTKSQRQLKEEETQGRISGSQDWKEKRGETGESKGSYPLQGWF